MRGEETGIDDQAGGLQGPRIDETKEQYLMALEAAQLGTWDYFPRTGQMTWSDRCATLMGMSPAEKANYDSFIQHIHAEDRALVNDQIQQTL
ncbi:MAG TPA: PAS domain-containing protein, partial [Ferruginibacter sp.]|nr:PAS domain-containing protein [Ferruginibacter sp.]